MMYYVLITTGWILCGVFSYYVVRDAILRESCFFTKGDRRYCIWISLLGPISLGATSLCWVLFKPKTREKRLRDEEVLYTRKNK